MGKVMSMVSRRLNRFNVENRAHRLLEREKPTPAPKYESNLRDMDRTLELDPNFVKNLSTKDASLDNRLKNVYVTSQDSFIDYRKQKSGERRALPLDRVTPEDFEYGYKESERVPPGRCTLRQALKFINDHQNDPELWTSAKIAEDYKLKPENVENILKYFKTFNMYLPDEKYQDKLLIQSKQKQLENTTESKSDSQ